MDKFQDIIAKIESLNVLELSELVKTLEEKFGVSAAMPMAVAESSPDAAAEETKTAWDVLLKAAGDQKIAVIKLVKEAAGVGLQEAKALVDGAPKVVRQGLKKEEAEELKKKLETAGAVIELQ